MSYPRDLDDYADVELRAELRNREKLREIGVCDYCKRDPSTPPCRYPERHHATSDSARSSTPKERT